MIHVGQMTRIGEGRSTETRVKEKGRSTVDTQAKAAKITSPRNLAASSFDHAEPIVTDLISFVRTSSRSVPGSVGRLLRVAKTSICSKISYTIFDKPVYFIKIVNAVLVSTIPCSPPSLQ